MLIVQPISQLQRSHVVGGDFNDLSDWLFGSRKMKRLKPLVKSLASKAGLHVVLQRNNPEHTMAGLRARDFDIILDVGANIGQFARKARSIWPAARIHCLEPAPEPYSKLEAWAAVSPGVVTSNVGLGEEPGVINLNFHEAHSAISSFLSMGEKTKQLVPGIEEATTVPVNVITLDQYVAELEAPIAGSTLLKLDVQGYEASVMRGAPKTLKMVDALIAEVCVALLYEGQSCFADIVGLATAGGLTYAGNVSQSYDANGSVTWLDALFVR